MKKRPETVRRLVAPIAAALLLPVAVLAEAPDPSVDTEPPGEAEVATLRPENGIEGWFHLGAWASDRDDSPLVIEKFEPDEDENLQSSLDLVTIHERIFLELAAGIRASDDRRAELTFDVGRTFRSSTAWNEFPVALAHDPMTNLVAATSHGRVVEHTDLDPNAEYRLGWSRLEHRSELQLPSAPALTLGLGYRLQERTGTIQAQTISHCQTCHVTSQSRPLDETTEDVAFDATLDLAKVQLRASWSHRELDESVQALSLLYDDAIHPEARTPVFDNRLQWDSAEGPQPVAQRPDSEKDVLKLELNAPSLAGFDLGLTGVWSTTENTLTGVESEYTGTLVDVTRPLGEKWRLRWRNRAYSIDVDDVLVVLNERLGIAGPQAGRTYAEIYGLPASEYLRLSSADRDVLESRLELAWRISRKAGSLRFLWDFERTDRDHVEVAPGEGETTENVLGLTWTARPVKGLRVHAQLRHGEVDHPFANLNGAYSALVTTETAPNPFAPTATQYYEFQGARIADPSAHPETWDRAEIRLSRTLGDGQTLLTASYRYENGVNDSLDLGDWERTDQALTATVFRAIDARTSWHLAFAHHESEVKHPSSIPIFDG